MKSKFEGVGVALVTPMTKNGDVDENGLEKLLKHTGTYVNYFVVNGTTGESAVTSKAEKNAILKFVLDHNENNLPVVFGIGGNNTQLVIDTIHSTDFTGISGILSVCPYYVKPSPRGLIAHYTAIADACPVPVIMYNVPGRTGVNMSHETILELAKHPNIAGVKEASGKMDQCLRVGKGTSDSFLLISGDDLLTIPIMSVGGSGVISVMANAYPELFHKMVHESLKGNFSEAIKASYRTSVLNKLLYEEANPVGVKQVLAEKGICDPHVRLPNVEASDSLKQRIRQAIKEIEG